MPLASCVRLGAALFPGPLCHELGPYKSIVVLLRIDRRPAEHSRRTASPSRECLRIRRRQVAGPGRAFLNRSRNSLPPGGVSMGPKGGSCMTLGEEIRGHLPFLRRYARALTGSQQHGDNFVHTLLEVIVAAPEEFEPIPDARTALYRAFHRIWETVFLSDGEG